MADVLSKRNRFKVDRVATKGGNSEDDGDDSSEVCVQTDLTLFLSLASLHKIT
jgi:hypothetical protein